MLKKSPQYPVYLLVIFLAFILATGTFAALYYITTRPEQPAGTEEVVVAGVTFVVHSPPGQRVRLLPPSEPVTTAPDPAPETDQPAPESGQGNQAPAPTAVPTETPLPPTAQPDIPQTITEPYTVQQTDTLYSIASSREDTSIPLMARGGISAANLIPGVEIQLPIVNPNYCPDAGQRPYLVHVGDTAYSLGRHFNTTADNLRAINGLDENYMIRIADVICVPNQ